MLDSQLEDVFNAALQKQNLGERSAFLDGACSGNADLRSRVEVLLKAHEDAGNFLKAAPTEDLGGEQSEGTVIGRYKLLQEIGEGGFGVVYMAEQLEPVRRKVALKIIKLGMDTKQVVARFEAERQALALMNHANIARVFDAGATASGRPYFVMELVRGVPITEYCDQNQLSAHARLELFVNVCQAVQHAHQKGIIHRDLKPTNVLVTLYDGSPVAKVIDFGIAKATNQQLTEKTLFTKYEQLIGTPQYMSPEQAEMSGLDIDTRSDIYSLGVLLYELLTGSTPFDSEDFRKAGYSEIQRIIREEEPPTPSARVHTTKNGASVAKRRQAEPAALSRLIRGDLDWIVMKALEKDRTRRYDTARDLAFDIQRYLDNEPVTAGPPSTVYKMRKFVRRNKVAVAAGLTVCVALLIGMSVATIGLLKANSEAAHSQEIADFLQEMLASVDPQESVDHDIDVAHVLERTRELFGEDHSTVAATLSSMALQLQYSGNLDAAEPLYRESIRIWKHLHGENHVTVGRTMTRLGRLLQDKGDDVGAEAALREGLALTRDLPGHGKYASCDTRFELAQLLTRRGKHAEAEQLLRETVALRKEQGVNKGFRIGTVLEQLVIVLSAQGKRDEAKQRLRETHEAYVGVFDKDSLRAAALNAGCGLWYRQNGDNEEALELMAEAVRVFRLHENPPRELYLVALDTVFQSKIKDEQGTEEAIVVFHELMKNMTYVYGSQHLLIAPRYFNFARQLSMRKRDADAIRLVVEGIRLVRESEGEGWKDEKRIQTLEDLTRRVLISRGLKKTQYQSALLGAETLSEVRPNNASFIGLLGIAHFRQGDHVKALEYLNAAKKNPEVTTQAKDYIDVFLSMALFQSGKVAEAERLLTGLSSKKTATIRDDSNQLTPFGSVLVEAEEMISQTAAGGNG